MRPARIELTLRDLESPALAVELRTHKNCKVGRHSNRSISKWPTFLRFSLDPI